MTHPNPARRRLLNALALAPVAGALPFAAQAQEGGTLRLVVPFTPGTTPDLCARLIGPVWAKRFSKTVVTDNRPGASGMLGLDAVAKAAPDGNTLLFGTNTQLTLPFVYAKVPFDVINSFSAIGLIGSTPMALVVHPSVAVNNTRELVAWLKAQPQSTDYASPGKGTVHHLTMEYFAHLSGTKLNHVPYKGSAPALADVLGGHVKLTIVPMHVAAPHAAEGKLRVMGVSSRERDPGFPNVPTLAETGVPGMDTEAWYAVYGPRGLPPAMVATYNEALRAALADPEVLSTLSKQGVTPRPNSPEQFARLMREEHDKWGRLIKAINLPQE
ncbi:Bug family tripartite tricarboxylate transporter substrate binding protein [Aquabacterium sp. J223]|uniref:Bug family tripartite tricarboxylate transporter substrate binding protein n=1 Tax=Aquabacterium sp. J223 TaxID=2898431 RepID=UPI0021AD6AB1|nr:tripartite tricarboxylate transporter substrate binding protein [Aquabacterium sp. J223]UUX95651.1 tripartite tricarboxylate transporter substrate binding protein [Aquabacterium sp. J223]